MAEQKRKLHKRNRWADVLAAILLCLAVVVCALWLRDYIRAKALSFATAEEGAISMTLPAELLVLRHEQLLYAPEAGGFTAEVTEGERVKEGAVIGHSGIAALQAQSSGIISFQLDGWEEKLQPHLLAELDLPQVFRQVRQQYAAMPADDSNTDDDAAGRAADESAGAAAAPDDTAPAPQLPEALNTAAGRPVARLVDNLLDYTLVLKVTDTRNLLLEADTINFTLADGQSFSLAYDDRGQTDDGDSYFVFTLSSGEGMLLHLRYSEAEVVARNITGILVPSSAVTVNEAGRLGVFIQRKRKVVFREVAELASRDNISVISGIDKNVLVVTNPAKASDGQRIY